MNCRVSFLESANILANVKVKKTKQRLKQELRVDKESFDEIPFKESFFVKAAKY